MKPNMWIQPLIDIWMEKAKECYNITLSLDDEKWSEIQNKYHSFFETYPLTFELFSVWNSSEQNDLRIKTSRFTNYNISGDDLEFSILMLENMLAAEIIFQHLKKSLEEKDENLKLDKHSNTIFYKNRRVTEWIISRYSASYQGVYVQMKMFEETNKLEGDMQTVLEKIDEILQRQWNLNRLQLLTK